MYLEYGERFALLLNDLNGSIKLSPRKYPSDDCL